MSNNKKPRKTADKSKVKERVSMYLDADMIIFLDKQAEAIRVSRVFMIRRLILKEMATKSQPQL